MFSTNDFKQSIKQWIKSNPDGSEQDLLDFCEEQIPPQQYTSMAWLIDQTMCWYRYVLAQRDLTSQPLCDDRDVV